MVPLKTKSQRTFKMPAQRASMQVPAFMQAQSMSSVSLLYRKTAVRGVQHWRSHHNRTRDLSAPPDPCNTPSASGTFRPASFTGAWPRLLWARSSARRSVAAVPAGVGFGRWSLVALFRILVHPSAPGTPPARRGPPARQRGAQSAGGAVGFRHAGSAGAAGGHRAVQRR